MRRLGFEAGRQGWRPAFGFGLEAVRACLCNR